MRPFFFCGNRNVSNDWGKESRSQYGCADRMALGDGQVSVWMGQSVRIWMRQAVMR